MYARLAERPSSPTSWGSTFSSRSKLQEEVSLWRLRAGIDRRWRVLAPELAPASRILDVGCGLGTWARFLTERGHHVCGVDFSLDLLARARAAADVLIEACAAAATALPFEDGSFTAIISWGVIEHDEDGPAAALREFRRVLRPGGKIYVTVPLDSSRGREIERSHGHQAKGVFYEYHFRPSELAAELTRAGFESVTSDPITKSPHLAAPRLYRWLTRRPPIIRDIGIQLLKPATFGRSDCFHMLLGSGRVPPAADGTHERSP